MDIRQFVERRHRAAQVAVGGEGVRADPCPLAVADMAGAGAQVAGGGFQFISATCAVARNGRYRTWSPSACRKHSAILRAMY